MEDESKPHIIQESHSEDAKRISTGSLAVDSLIGGGLPVCAVTDVFGAAATGKTQFAFQCSLMTAVESLRARSAERNAAVFVDCAGSFRPERIAEMALARGFDPERILERISSIEVRSIAEQRRASERILEDDSFAGCRLVVVDDATTNFVSELSKSEDLIERQAVLSLYARDLSYLALKKKISILLTNSVRSRGDRLEGETTGEVLSQFTFLRLHFSKDERGNRFVEVEEPYFRQKWARFVIEGKGLP